MEGQPTELAESDYGPSDREDQRRPEGLDSGADDDTIIGHMGDEGKGKTHVTETDIMQLQFGTDDEAYEWYKMYAKCLGFGVRKDDCGYNSKGELTWRQFVCACEGKRAEKHVNRVDRKREPKPETRNNCRAMIRVKLDKHSKKWSVVKACVDHSHPLTPSEQAHMIPCHRSLNEADIAQVDSMRSCGVKTAHIMGFMCRQAGGPTGVGFCRKDLYNHLDKQRRSLIADGDAFAALSYLQAKADSDPMMFVKYTTDSEGRLENLFWCDGTSRVDYEIFGDVVAFDTTYRRNKYNKPLVIFSGVNHHHKTTVFACALLVDETVGTYRWVLEALLEAMGDKKPAAVVTDGDKAMRKAIKELFPESTHRLCAWHLQRNAKTNIKHEGFSDDMWRCLYVNMTTEQWEREWENLVAKYDVSEHRWVKKMYKRRAMWATSWLRGKFFAGIRTTSMCEGINSFIKNYVQSKHSLTEFLHHFERAIGEYRTNELNADFNSSYGEPVLTSALRGIEKSAATIYTRELFIMFKGQLNDVIALIATPRDIINTTVTYDVSDYREPSIQWVVHCDRSAKLLRCSCSFFESRGIPCSHLIYIMKHERMDSLPPSLICKRWTKNCKTVDLGLCGSSKDSGERLARLRYSALVASANRMCYLASQDDAFFTEARETICSMSAKFEGQREVGMIGSSSPKVVSGATIRDPAKVKTKGGPKKSGKRNKCTKCRSTGHNIRKCPLLVGFTRDNDRASSTESEDEGISFKNIGDQESEVGHCMEHAYKAAVDEIKDELPSFPTQQSGYFDSAHSPWIP